MGDAKVQGAEIEVEGMAAEERDLDQWMGGMEEEALGTTSGAGLEEAGVRGLGGGQRRWEDQMVTVG